MENQIYEILKVLDETRRRFAIDELNTYARYYNNKISEYIYIAKQNSINYKLQIWYSIEESLEYHETINKCKMLIEK